ncbi:MAG: hypothetical protein C4526_01040 [Nitrospiraceae bacterium]|nr:MAG: hypothetical protein C4526_01040 [Nitrospiraceae bacterium]
MPDLEKKLYQLIISRIDGEKLSSAPHRQRAFELAEKGVGGFILFGGRKDEVKSFIAGLQSVSEIPLFIASDIERGAGQQFEGATRFPFQMAAAAATDKNMADDVKALQDMVKAIADEAADIGINMPLVPVLDVNVNPDNPIICTRAFSDRPEEVAWFGRIYIRILEESGLISCAKHFPGHGDTSVDSHISLPVISKSVKEIKETDLFPFNEAVKAGVGSIMIGHLGIPALDALPASLSKKVITGLLRKELGYEGLILTDALNMSALKEVENVPAKCLNAGVDVLLHPADADAVVEELKQAVASGELEEEKIDRAVERILRYRNRVGAIHELPLQAESYAELSQLIFDKSITLVKNTPGLLPIKNTQNVSLVFAGDEKLYGTSPLRGLVPAGPGLKPAPAIIAAVFTNVAAWKGSSGISVEEIRRIKELTGKSRQSIVISFGSPYVLRHFPEAGALIAAYDTAEQAQVSVIKCLKGETGFQGRLPVKLDYDEDSE